MLNAILGIVIGLIIIYLLLIMPRLFHRPDFGPFNGVLYAHRGFHNNESIAPENSLSAFQFAVEHGYGIELDIQLSKDQVPVVFHDYTLTRMCNVEKRVDELTLEELKKLRLANGTEKIPTLEEALSVINGKVPLIVEYKVELGDLSLCEKAMPILDVYKGIYCMESFNPLVLRWFKKNRGNIIRGQLSSHFNKDKEEGNQVVYFFLSRLLFNFLGRPDFISYNYRYPKMVSLLLCKHLYRIPLAAWTVKSQGDLVGSKRYFNYIIFDSFTPR